MERLAKVYEAGAVKYGDHNWQKGQPLSRFLDSALRHINKSAQGYEDEDHLFQAVWNLIGIAWTLEQVRQRQLPQELLDLPYSITVLRETELRPELTSGKLEDCPLDY